MTATGYPKTTIMRLYNFLNRQVMMMTMILVLQKKQNLDEKNQYQRLMLKQLAHKERVWLALSIKIAI